MSEKEQHDLELYKLTSPAPSAEAWGFAMCRPMVQVGNPTRSRPCLRSHDDSPPYALGGFTPGQRMQVLRSSPHGDKACLKQSSEPMMHDWGTIANRQAVEG